MWRGRTAYDPEFQFHYGAIKGLLNEAHDRALVLFQFHYGAIKGENQTKNEEVKIYFNSTMVRLKVLCIRHKL